MTARITASMLRRGSFLLVFVALMSMLLPAGSSKTLFAQAAVPEAAVSASGMLQFKAGGHLLGFDAGKVYLASLDHALRVDFVGAERVVPQSAQISSADERRFGAPQFEGVTYRQVWEGIDISYRTAGSAIAKSEYRLAPGADASQIRLHANVPVYIQNDGSLRYGLATRRGWMSESAPVAWQEIGGRQVAIEIQFDILADDTVGFKMGKHDPQYPVIIDPSYQWHSFYGSNLYDAGAAIAVDVSGNIYIAGSSDGLWNGDGGVLPLRTNIGGGDIVVVKLNSSGSYLWHTYYGSSAQDSGYGIAVDSIGNIVVIGSSSSSWPGDFNSNPLHAHGGGASDIVVIKLNSNGAYQWHTFYGGSDADEGHSVAVDGANNIYLTGSSNASWLGDLGVSPLHAHSGQSDIIVMKLNNFGVYQWHSFYGSSSSDAGWGIAMDTGNNVYVAGYSLASWQGNGDANPIHSHSGLTDMVVLKLTGNGGFLWHTFFGAAGADIAWGIDVDGGGNVYVAGNSSQTWLGSGNASPIHAHSGTNDDIVVLKLNTNGAYQWHTFYGSTGSDSAHAITIDPNGYLLLTGISQLFWQGDGFTNPIHGHSGYQDIFVLKLNSGGAYQWHTFYGSGSYDIGNGIAADNLGNIQIAGQSDASWLGDGDAAPKHARSDGSDIVVLRLAAQYRLCLPVIVK